MNKKMASVEFIEVVIKDLETAFPNNSKRFWDLLIERIRIHECTESEMIYASGFVIDSKSKGSLTVADIIQLILKNRNQNIVN